MKQKKKPALSLLRGDNITGETIAAMCKQLTGKDSTKEEIANAQAILDKAKKTITYEYRIIDGDTLARVELLDGKMTVNGAMIFHGEWFPTYPLDIIWEGRLLTAHEQATLIKPSETLTVAACTKKKLANIKSWTNENWVGRTPEQILGIARQAYTGFYEANT